MNRCIAVGLVLLGFQPLDVSATEAPSWIEGVRSGAESLRIVNGSKVMFRRILGAGGLSPDDTCKKAIDLVEADLVNESILDVRIPYTLDYLYFDKSHEDCAVTISVSTAMLDKVKSIRALKEKNNQEIELIKLQHQVELAEKKRLQQENKKLEDFIRGNRYLLDRFSKLTNQADAIRASIKNEQDSVENLFVTGMRVGQLSKLIGAKISISIGSSLCYAIFDTFKSSAHGNVVVCWEGAPHNEYVKGLCFARTGKCVTRDP